MLRHFKFNSVLKIDATFNAIWIYVSIHLQHVGLLLCFYSSVTYQGFSLHLKLVYSKQTTVNTKLARKIPVFIYYLCYWVILKHTCSGLFDRLYKLELNLLNFSGVGTEYWSAVFRYSQILHSSLIGHLKELSFSRKLKFIFPISLQPNGVN